jgi:hypothetical protein
VCVVDYVWIGLEDFAQENQFVWVSTQETPEFTDWGAGEPNDYDHDPSHPGHNEDCVWIWRNKWNDADCSEKQWALCETE